MEKPRGLSRREAARRLLAGMAAGAMPWGTAEHPIWKHFEDLQVMSHAEVAANEVRTVFLNWQQMFLFVALAEAIVPGSSKAYVAGFVDLLLSVESEKHQKEFVNSLAAIETESNSKYGKSFKSLSDSQKNELLKAVSEADKGKDGQASLRDAFENLKEWVSGAYYSSEIGMKELGWTPNRFFPQFPGCEPSEEHASH